MLKRTTFAGILAAVLIVGGATTASALSGSWEISTSGTTYQKTVGGSVAGCYVYIRLDKPTKNAYTQIDSSRGTPNCKKLGVRVQFIPTGVNTTAWTSTNYSTGSIVYAPQNYVGSAIKSWHFAERN